MAEFYVEQEVIPFIESWDPDIFVSLAPPSRRNTERLTTNAPAFCAQFAEIGKPETLAKPEGYVRFAFDRGILPSLTAFVQVQGEFPTGPAQIAIELLRENGHWFIDGVTVKSDYYLQRPAK